MADITVYRPDENRLFANATEIRIENGVLTFYWRGDSMSFESTKITTTCPYFIEEKIGGR